MAEQDGQPAIGTGPPGLTWVKSSASGSGGSGGCVEVATSAGHVHLRDSKHPGPELSFIPEAWRAFLRSRR